jgi:Uri superfamily endonuclease
VIPALPGTYILIMRCTKTGSVAIGRFGDLAIRPGHYLYVGSALGPGGLRSRLNRHLRASRILHWHVDYVRPAMKVEEVWYAAGAGRREHEWASILVGMPGMSVPIPRFGASDCSCPAHLFYNAESPLLASFQALTQPGTPIIERLPIICAPQGGLP